MSGPWGRTARFCIGVIGLIDEGCIGLMPAIAGPLGPNAIVSTFLCVSALGALNDVAKEDGQAQETARIVGREGGRDSAQA